MLPETARWLTSDDGRGWLASGLDPSSLADAERLRRELDPERAAAVIGQIALRRKAVAKFGAMASGMFFTSAGLEQATRPSVAAWRARRFVEAGASRVLDLGCGIGADSLAFVEAGLGVRLVELDEVTAIFAEANVGIPAEVADATTVELASEDAVFCDPARRTARGRTWRVDDFTPDWGFATGLLRGRLANLKIGPGVPYALLPDHAATTWVSDHGDVIEASVWSMGEPGSRSAVLLPSGWTSTLRPDSTPAATRPVNPGDIVCEPDGAIIRAGLVDDLAGRFDAARIHPGIAYLASADAPADLMAAGAVTAFRVDDVLPFNEKALRVWARDAAIGTLEIKKRGLEIDPAVLRKRLRPKGGVPATLVCTPTPTGAVALVVTRLAVK